MKFELEKSIQTNNTQDLVTENLPVPEPVEEIESKDRALEDPFTEKYKKEILPVLESLRPDDVSITEYEEQVMAELFDDVKKRQIAEGKLMEDQMKTLEEVKEMLVSRVKSVLFEEAKQRSDSKKKVDPDLVRRSKIALLRSGDLSGLREYVGKDKQIEKIEFGSIQHYLGRHWDSGKKKLTERELNELVEAGFGDQLAKMQTYSFDDNLENTPESLFLGMIKEHEFSWLSTVIERHPSKEKYSREVFEKLSLKGPNSIVLKNIEKFNRVNFKEAVDLYSPGYPYYAADMIEKLRSLGLPTDQFNENLEYIVKHQKITRRDDYDIPEIRENYKNVLDRVDLLRERWDGGPIEIDPIEGLRISKELIADGYISFLHENWKFVKKLAEEDYDWLLDQLKKHDQEYFLLGNRDLLKPKDQTDYAKKLINQGKDCLVIAEATRTNDDRRIFGDNILDQEIFDALSQKNCDPIKVLESFSNLNEETFIQILKSGYFEQKDLENHLARFKFSKDSYSVQLLEETDNFNKNLKLYYVNKFIDTNDLAERNQFIGEYKKQVTELSQNEKIEIEDKKLYELVLREVYPERNYDTYKNLHQYEDRTKDLDKYDFDRNGYEMRIDGVVGYKIKEGESINQQIVADFSKRVEDIKDISNTERLGEFLNGEILDSKAETLEGKILEYFNQKGYTLDTMNILLAYQLQGQYDQFVAGSTDRVAGAEDQISKNYILLDELANRYGDSMKETIKAVQEAVANSKDQELFASNVVGEHGETYESLAQSILDGLNKIPADKITDKTIQMNILKAVKNTFQGVQNLQERAKYFSELFSKNDLENFSEVWKKHTDQLFVVSDAYAIDMKKIQALQSNVYQTIQNEIGKYEEIREVDAGRGGEVKGSKERLVRGYFSKNKENAHARMVGDVCLASDPNMLKNDKYLEFVMFDQEKQKCVGTTMLLNMPEPDGKKYLLYCPNPSVGLVSEVSAKKLYQTMTNRIKTFAEENGFDGVLVDKTHGKSTNRAGLFQNSLDQSCLKDTKGSDKIMNLKQSHLLGGGYSYKDRLQIIWQK